MCFFFFGGGSSGGQNHYQADMEHKPTYSELQANSGHPGTPMAMAPVAYALWARPGWRDAKAKARDVRGARGRG